MIVRINDFPVIGDLSEKRILGSPGGANSANEMYGVELFLR